MAGIRITVHVAAVLAEFLAEPTADRYGLELMRGTGLPSGTLYPVLDRLRSAGWVTCAWEEVDPAAAGRPARRYYRLTPDGVTAARAALADLHARTRPGGGRVGNPRPAVQRLGNPRPAVQRLGGVGSAVQRLTTRRTAW